MPQRFLLPPNATVRTKPVPIYDAVRQYADVYLDDALVPADSATDTGAAFADVRSGFRLFLLNRSVVLRGRMTVDVPLVDALRAKGVTLSPTHLYLVGWRFRTPADTR